MVRVSVLFRLWKTCLERGVLGVRWKLGCSSTSWLRYRSNNSYHSSERLQETIGKISQIKDRLKDARDHEKSYADKRRKPLEF
ncbi:hypothetical protein Tco_1163982 [Tanacetum coccineum]